MKSLPADAEVYKTTPVFTEHSVPAGLLRHHQTKHGTWARIVVFEGRLNYRILEPDVEEVELSPSLEGVIEPQVMHEVALIGPVRFQVQFCRRPADATRDRAPETAMAEVDEDALARALSDAASAHHEYEQVALSGERDELWAGFYAAFVLGRLGAFVQPSALVRWLKEAPSDDDWATEAARYVLGELRLERG